MPLIPPAPTPHRLGKRQVWKSRWFHLYGNHLVYYAGAFEQVNMARPRGVIHLSPETRVFIDAAHDGSVFELNSQVV